MHKYLVVCLFILTAASCKDKPVSLSGNGPVDAKYFIAAFKPLSLPYRVADTSMIKAADTTNISYAVFTQFIPDSVMVNIFGKNAKKMKINPVGRIEKEKELYLLVNFTQNKKTALHSFLFNKENKYLAELELLKQGIKDGYLHSVSITSEPTFIISREKTNANSELFYTKNGYAYNNGSGSFTAVMTDSNEDLKRINEIINPIDTLPRKNKLSGDYADNKRNFISLRDGSNTNKYSFFIHFEKDNGNCTGELKGTMTMRDATHGYFRESGDPCVIDFTFEGRTITVKEQGNCGNHRGIKCFFDDSFTKKKEAKPAKKSK
ncbi:MAG TPA: hypothetical protein PLA68_11290 [Panacibacter sp.]|nr:hypothetical protein [Panacibacter sp.]